MWITLAFASAFFAGITSILAKCGIKKTDSDIATAIRTIVVLAFAWLIAFLVDSQGEIQDISRKTWLFLGCSGMATGASWLCCYRALQTGPASVIVPIDKLSILVTILFSHLVFREKLNRKAAVGLGMVITGTLAMLV